VGTEILLFSDINVIVQNVRLRLGIGTCGFSNSVLTSGFEKGDSLEFPNAKDGLT
jgi:hypothetical protein